MEEKKHIEKLDVLRGVAILLVFFFHSFILIFPDSKFTYNGFFINYTDTPIRQYVLNLNPMAMGWSGVELFFLISGFLIHFGYLQSKSNFKLLKFANKRFWRIWPPYIFTIFLLVFCFGQKVGMKDLATHILLVHNFDPHTFFGINPSFWSLAVEAQLYALYPLMLLLRKKMTINGVLLFTFLIAIFNILLWHFVPTENIALKGNVVGRWAIWVSGAWLAERYYRNERIKFNSFLLVLIGYIVICFFRTTVLWEYASAYFVGGFFLLAMEYYLFFNPSGSGVVGRTMKQILIKIGLCSYSIYLLHQPFVGKAMSIIHVFGLSDHSRLFRFLDASVAFLLIFAFSYAMYLFIEKGSVMIGQRVQKKWLK